MSNIPAARSLITLVLATGTICDSSRSALKTALKYMTREKALRRAPARYVRATQKIKEEVYRFADNTDMTTTEIAAQVGLRNGGRVTEILQDRERLRHVRRRTRHTPSSGQPRKASSSTESERAGLS